MDYQILIVALVCTAAAGYLVSRLAAKIKTFKSKKNCAIDCGCGDKSSQKLNQNFRR